MKTTNHKVIPERNIYLFGCIVIILLPNHDIFNWIFSGTVLTVWKQILLLILSILSFQIVSAKRSAINGQTKNIRIVVFVLVFVIIFTITTSLIQGLSLIRVAYAVFAYIGLIGALGLAVATMTLEKTIPLLRLITLLGLFSSVGLIVDYFTGFFDFLPRSQGSDIYEQITFGYLRRSSFLFGASTTIFPFLSFSFLAAAILFFRQIRVYDSFFFLSLLVLTPIAFFLTGSRSQLILMLTFSIGILVILYAKLLRRKIILLIILIPLIIYFVKLIEQAEQSYLLVDRYMDAFDKDVVGNDLRYLLWSKGVELFTVFDLNSLVGVGLGKSMGMINDGAETITHYESSLFQAFSEAGWLGLILRYFPMLIALRLLIKYKGKNFIVKNMFILWFFVYFLSVFSAPTAGAYHTQMVYFLAVAFSIKIEKFCFSIGLKSTYST